MANLKCEICGKKLTAWNRSFPSRKCNDCSKGKNPKVQEKEFFDSFQEHKDLTDTAISDRPVAATAGRIVIGALIVNTATYIGGLVPTESIVPSFIGCFIGLGIVSSILFCQADVLDKKRWWRYWHGDLLGYWLTYVPITFAIVANLSQEQYYSDNDLLFMDFGAYILASGVGLAVGFINVCRTDSEDKAEILRYFKQWQASKDTTPHESDADGISAENTQLLKQDVRTS